MPTLGWQQVAHPRLGTTPTSSVSRDSRSGQRFLATTNRGLEAVAIDEISALIGASAEISYPGVVQFRAPEETVYRLHARTRSLHRVLFELARTEVEEIDDVTALVDQFELCRYLGPDQSFAVRAKRRGDHPFTSPAIEREVGQAIVDHYRRREGTRPPVDLEDPDCVFRVIVRDRTARIALDATGQRSLHRRWYRINEHEAALRPTIAYSMYYYANPGPGDSVVDPMCGCGTIPIEAALAATGRSPTRNHDPALTGFQFLDPDRYRDAQRDDTVDCELAVSGVDREIAVSGYDIDPAAVAGAQANAREASLTEQIGFEQADATTVDIDADIVVTDLPFGIRTDGDIHSLYATFFDALARRDWDRLVVHTAREELVPFEASEQIEMRRGRLETSILVIE